jgi:rhodanese-related sulfurtransferase
MVSLYFGLSVLFVILAIAFLSKKKQGAEVTAPVARDMMKDPQVIVLDVRSPQEHAQSHIEGSKLIPVAELADRVNELNDYKNREILIYCYRGNRSKTAYRILEKNGFSNIKNLQGGITAWINAGYNVVSGE